VASVLPELVGRSFAPLAAAEEVDLLSEVLLPLIDAIMALLLGIDAESLWRFRRVPGIFDRMIGLRRRKELELEVGIARSALASQREDADPLFTLMALGHDALLGTIGESLHRLIAADPGRRLSEIAYPAVPIETGVPYVERVVKQAFELDGNSFRGGDRIRILMQAFAYSGSEQSRLHMFGVGPHACIGRQLSLDLWSRITAVLAQVRRRAEVVKHALRTNDYIWTCPSELRIRLYDDDL
jgi:cytochrome P450